MTTEQHRFEKIERFLTNQLPQNEHASFEAEIASSPELQKEVELHKKADHVIQYLSELELKKDLKSIDAEPANGIKRKPISRRIILIAVAASMVLLVGFGVVFSGVFSPSVDLTAELTNAYFVATTPEVYRGDNNAKSENYTQQLSKADDMFQNGEYKNAAVEYQRLASISHTLNDRAEWNLVLCYILNNTQPTEREQLLSRIASDKSHLYHEKAVELKALLDAQ